MRKILLVAVALAVLAGGGYAYYRYTNKTPPPAINTARVTRGDLAETVGATGALQAVTTVQVGTQVSGTILQLNADFNSLVRKGQVLARLDFESSLVQRYVDLTKHAVFYMDPHICMRCRYRSTELLWQCPHCHEWNTFVEDRIAPAKEPEELGV